MGLGVKYDADTRLLRSFKIVLVVLCHSSLNSYKLHFFKVTSLGYLI